MPLQMKVQPSVRKQWEARYAMVDAWRGLAALGVVCYHLGLRVGSGFGAILGTLGLISYSLYLTHQLNLRASSIVASRLTHLGLPQFSEVILRLIFSCAVATIFWFFCERPFLNKPLGGRTLAKPRMAACRGRAPAYRRDFLRST